MRCTPIFLALTIALAAATGLPSTPPAHAQAAAQMPPQTAPDPEVSHLIADYNERSSQPGLDEKDRIALAGQLDTELQALLRASVNDPERTRAIIAAMKAARLDLPLTDEVRVVLENAGKTAAEIRETQDEAAIADILSANAGNPDAIADAVSDYILVSDDPVRTTAVAAAMAVRPQYEPMKTALGTGIGRAIATLGLTEPALAEQMLAAAQQVDDPELQTAIASGEQDIPGATSPSLSDTTGNLPVDTTPEEPASAS